jgi:hypothetical protein
MGYGADITPFLLHAEATAMRATCVQMCHAIERVPVWPTPVALTRIDLSCNVIGNVGAAALAAQLQVRSYLCAGACGPWVASRASAGQDGGVLSAVKQYRQNCQAIERHI